MNLIAHKTMRRMKQQYLLGKRIAKPNECKFEKELVTDDSLSPAGLVNQSHTSKHFTAVLGFISK